MTRTQLITMRLLARHGLNPRPAELREMARWSDRELDTPQVRRPIIRIALLAFGIWAVVLSPLWAPRLWRALQ
jgi:hypothetical protein